MNGIQRNLQAVLESKVGRGKVLLLIGPRSKCPLTFSNNYPDVPFSVVTQDNYMDFVTER